jgi:hypothetical protein
MLGFIYITTNNITGRKYIGKRQITWNHYSIDSYLGSSRALKEDILLHGVENFTREILEYADTRVELAKLEIEYLRKYNAVKDENFYNLTIPRLSWAEGWIERKEDPKTTKKRADKMRGVKRNKYNMKVEFRDLSEEVKSLIIELHNTGATPWSIHKQTKFHCDGIKRFLIKSGLTPNKEKFWQNKWTSSEEQEIVDLFNIGLSCKEISVKTGRNITRISSKLKELGIKLRDPNHYKIKGTNL